MSSIRFVFIVSVLLCLCTGCGAKGSGLIEGFEQGSKDSYAEGYVGLSSGKWLLNDALIGNTAADKKNGASCLRIRNSGAAGMEYDITGEIKQVSVAHATYGKDDGAKWQLQYSKNGGKDWQTATPIITSSTVLSRAVFNIGHSGSIRFRVQKLNGGRLNIDDIQTNPGGETFTGSERLTARIPVPKSISGKDDNMALGNPSGANKGTPANYLLVRPQYALSYNNEKGIPNWVSWHLSTAWKGDVERCNCFAPDKGLPPDYFIVLSSIYTATGFDRGHLCPSDDRDGSKEDNAATFLMSNIAPQAPNLNRDVWENLESYCRKLISNGNELYIISGSHGKGGTGDKGYKEQIGKVSVPASFWKVIVILPVGDNDMVRISANTRTIAVNMPNSQRVNTYPWQHYRTSIDAIERLTGYDLLSKVPKETQKVIEARTDAGPTR